MKLDDVTVKCPDTGTDLKIVKAGEYNTGMLALAVIAKVTGEPWATITVNVNAHLPDSRCVTIKNYSENANLVQPLLDTGIFEEMHQWISSGHVKVPIWRIKDEVML